MSRIVEIIYLGRDNAIDVQLKTDGVVADLGPITQIDLIEKDGIWLVSSATSSEAFDWTVGNGTVSMQLGGEALPIGTHKCYLIIYDPTNPNGIVWEDLKVTVKEV